MGGCSSGCSPQVVVESEGTRGRRNNRTSSFGFRSSTGGVSHTELTTGESTRQSIKRNQWARHSVRNCSTASAASRRPELETLHESFLDSKSPASSKTARSSPGRLHMLSSSGNNNQHNSYQRNQHGRANGAMESDDEVIHCTESADELDDQLIATAPPVAMRRRQMSLQVVRGEQLHDTSVQHVPRNRLVMRAVVVGAPGVGKSSLAVSAVGRTSVMASGTAAFLSKQVEVTLSRTRYNVNLQMWDVCGVRRFQQHPRTYITLADAALICFDPGSAEGAHSALDWARHVTSVNDDIRLYFVSCKYDLHIDSEKQLSAAIEPVAEFCQQHAHYSLHYVSVRQPGLIDELLQRVASDHARPQRRSSTPFALNIDDPPKKQSLLKRTFTVGSNKKKERSYLQ